MINIKEKECRDLCLSKNKEVLLVNTNGCTFNTTVSGVNTRKYHGIFASRLPLESDFNHIYLSTIEALFNLNGTELNINSRQYPGEINPKGYKNLKKFEWKTHPTWLFKNSSIQIEQKIILHPEKDILFIEYHNQSNADINLKWFPFTAFREIHQLTFENTSINTELTALENGITVQQYTNHKQLTIQHNSTLQFEPHPYWHKNIEYTEEKNRGYDYQEDLFVYGSFNGVIQKGAKLIFVISHETHSTETINKLFKSTLKKCTPVTDLVSALSFSAKQFITKTQEKGYEICAGYPWFGRWGRDTFLALPGLMQHFKTTDFAEAVIDAMLTDLSQGLFTNIGIGGKAKYNSADASLYFFWTLQNLSEFKGETYVWEKYHPFMLDILTHYQKGTHYNIHCSDNGLLHAGADGVALTWMDAVINNNPVTPRRGWAIDLQALWYNAICFTLHLSKKNNSKHLTKQWEKLPELIQHSFQQYFWLNKKEYFADYVSEEITNTQLRPNQIFALALPFTLATPEQIKKTLKVIKTQLLTPKGLRTLAPNDPEYIGIYQGGQEERDKSYHQGITWPWLLGFYADALIKLKNNSLIKLKNNSLIKDLNKIVCNFENDMHEYGLRSIAEIYNSEAPFAPKGTISQAWSVSEILRIIEKIKQIA